MVLGATGTQVRRVTATGLHACGQRPRVAEAGDDRAKSHTPAGHRGVHVGRDVEATVAVHPAAGEPGPVVVAANLDHHGAAGAAAAGADAAVHAHHARPVEARGAHG